MIFLRPYCLFAFIPLAMLAFYLWFRPQSKLDWQKVCDSTLLNFFLHTQTQRAFWMTYWPFVFSLSLLVFALAGPSWHQLPTSMGQIQKPIMVVMDLSTQMLMDDVSPSRLERSKMLLQDWLKAHRDAQWGLVVFSDFPFVVTPMTSDIDNILTFLPLLTPKLLPIGGYQVTKAIDKGAQLLKQAGFSSGKMILISGQSLQPGTLKNLPKGVDLKVLSVGVDTDFKKSSQEISNWIDDLGLHQATYCASNYRELQWEDEGRLFLFLAMLPLMFVFRKGWFLRLWV